MGPIDNIRVVELGHALAGPLAATLLGDFGADVIKVERPDGGDSLRKMGPQCDGVGIWWLVTGRNKKSITLDLKKSEGRQILLDLLKEADVVVENYRPGVMEGLGLGWDALRQVNPRLIMLRISGFGQTGPNRDRGGFGKIAEAYSGATNLTGKRDESPIHPGYSLGDAVCALTGAFGVTLALLARQRTGAGQVPLYKLSGVNVTRNGAQFPFSEAFVTDICNTLDGHSVVVSAATADSIERLAQLLRDEGLVSGAKSSSQELGDGLRAWIARNDRAVVLEVLEQRKLVAGLVYTPADMIDDHHMQARGNIVNIEHSAVGSVPMPGVVPTLSRDPGTINWAGPSLGQHTDEILGGRLGYTSDKIAQLRSQRII